MALHFSKTELADRRRRACRAMTARGLDGLLLFRPCRARTPLGKCPTYRGVFLSRLTADS